MWKGVFKQLLMRMVDYDFPHLAKAAVLGIFALFVVHYEGENTVSLKLVVLDTFRVLENGSHREPLVSLKVYDIASIPVRHTLNRLVWSVSAAKFEVPRHVCLVVSLEWQMIIIYVFLEKFADEMYLAQVN